MYDLLTNKRNIFHQIKSSMHFNLFIKFSYSNVPDISKPLHLNPFAAQLPLLKYFVTLQIPDRCSIISNNVVQQNHTKVPSKGKKKVC